VLAPLGAGTPVFQWHGQSYALPAGAVQLARTATCEQQAFRWGELAYGFQFHLEVDEALIGRWLANPDHADELCVPGLPADADGIRARSAGLAPTMQRLAEPVFEGFLDLVGRPQRRVALPSREFA
jgi:GMP synthase (glutamine-hydrolysing)